jgi:hypothetical protein
MALSTSLDLQKLCREVRDSLHSALGLCQEALEKGGREEHIRRLGTPNPVGMSPSTHSRVLIDPQVMQDLSTPKPSRQAV